MESYEEMEKRHMAEFNAFPLGAAFTEKQLHEALIKLGLDPETGKSEVVSIGAGCFIRKKDMGAYKEMITRQAAELEAAINADETGEGFIYGMFCRELLNHEYGYTGDPQDALDALGINWNDIEERPALRHGLSLACKAVMEDTE